MTVLLVTLALSAAAVGGWLLRALGDKRHEAAVLARCREAATAAQSRAVVAEGRVQAVLDAFPHGAVLFDGGGRPGLANAAGRAFVGARHRNALVEAAARELASLVTRRGDGSARRLVEPAGNPRLAVEVLARRLTDGGAAVFLEDVTERRRLEEVRRDFVANISHELRTPLGALSLLAETLADEQDPEVAARLARRLQAEAIRLGRTVDDLVLLSGIEGGATQVEPVRLADAVGEAVERRSGLAEARQIEVKVDLAPSDLVLRADRRQLVSAVANLLDNALNYSDPGSVVLIRSQRVGERIELSVVDHGVGIPARDLERIFERFYRVDRARSRQTGGTGLGLAVVRHVVTNHGGDVVVHSREGEGSTFVLRLPLGDAGTGRPAALEEQP